MRLPDRAITIRWPWAGLVLLGLKGIELRGQPCPHRGPVVLHVARGVTPAHLEHLQAHRPDLAEYLAAPKCALWRRWPGIRCLEDLLGQAIGVVSIEDCRPAVAGDRVAALVEPSAAYPSPWALVLARPVVLPEPVLLTGQVAPTWLLGDQRARIVATLRPRAAVA